MTSFLLEAKIMTEFLHRNVLSLVGVATREQPWYVGYFACPVFLAPSLSFDGMCETARKIPFLNV